MYTDLVLGRTESSPLDFAEAGMRRSVDFAAGKLDCKVEETYGALFLGSSYVLSTKFCIRVEFPAPDELPAPPDELPAPLVSRVS